MPEGPLARRGQLANPCHPRDSRASLLVTTLLIGLIAAGCSDQEAGGPQFANEPAPTRAATRAVGGGSPVPLPTLATVATPIATPASMADLLRVRGAPAAVFLAVGNTVWAIDSDGVGEQIFIAPRGSEIRALDASPPADRAALLLRQSNGSRTSYEVVVVDRDGGVERRFDDFSSGQATPARGAVASADLIDWSPQGNRLLVAVSGETVVFPVDDEGAPEVVALAAAGTSVVDASWSPTGEAIAFIAARDEDRDRALWVYDTRDDDARRVVGSGDNRYVVEFAWLPDGMSLLFTEGGNLEGAVSGIDLWRVDADGKQRELVASAGTVAPVARITDIRPGPDGRSVAYAVLVPGDSGPRVDSVWVRDLASRVGFKIALPTVASIDEIAWTDKGLAIAVTSGGGRSGAPTAALLQVTGDGQVAALWAAPIATPTAPPASPRATPSAD